MNVEISAESKEITQNVLELFENKEIVKICAPMVRYSKIQFRNLVKKYGCDLVYTPMILADSFCKSGKARDNEFTTNLFDAPLITQFAAKTVHDFVGAAHMISPFCNGADLNCGCPQRWAKQQELGCVMLQKPELIYDLVRQCRNRINKPFTVSVKMRIMKDSRRSVEICRQLEKCGVSFLTVHARTAEQATGNINLEVLKLISECTNIPIVANGGVKSLEECMNLSQRTNCKGIMVANGLLTNPSLFIGSSSTTTECVQNWLNICFNSTLDSKTYLQLVKNPNLSGHIPENPNNLTFQCFHHHLVFMLEKILCKPDKKVFNNLQTFETVLQFIKNKFQLSPELFERDEFSNMYTMTLDYKNRDSVYHNLKPNLVNDSNDFNLFYDDYNTGGSRSNKYFENKLREADGCDWSDIFLENG